MKPLRLVNKCVITAVIVAATLAAVVAAVILANLTEGETMHKSDYEAEYLEVVKEPEGAQALDPRLAAFSALFADLKHPSLASLIEAAYAESFYFNDTFKTFRRREDLIAYLTGLSDRVETTEVMLLDSATRGADVYVRWGLRMRFKIFGKSIDSRSIGMTHLRFDGDGKIIVHQDFWDGVSGFYRHLPGLGWILERIRAGM